MRIYLAGLYETAISAVHRNPDHRNQEAIGDLVYPWILESFFYIGHGPTIQVIRERGEKVFLDSGAFSMFTQKKEVDLEAYADFIKENIDVIEIASNLDHIGRGGEQQTYDNQKRLEEFGVKIAPVHHARDEDSWLQRYLDEGYDHIFLGGMVPETTNYLRKWLDRIWPRYLCNPDGTAKVKVHGFGLTTEALMFRYPWFSVDSTSWVMTAAMGTLYLDLPHRNMKVCVSDSSPKMKKAGQHFSTLTDIEQKTIREYVHARGFNIEDLAEDYAWRWRWNVEFFRRQMEGAPEIKFIKQQTELFA